MADDHPPSAAVRAQADALARQTGEWAVVLPDSDPGTLDTAGHLRGDEVPELYSRTVALTAQRVRMLSAELARDVKLRGRAALVREDMLWDPEEGRPVVAREVPSGLAVLEGRERDRLARELREIVKIRLELQAARTRERDDAAARARQLREWQDDASRDLVLAVRAALEEAGRDWSAPETQELARRALDRVPGMRDGGGTMR